MGKGSRSILIACAAIAAWELGLRPFLAGPVEARSAPAPGKDNVELARMFAEDQADRQTADGKPIDWAIVLPRDRSRLARAGALYRGGELRSGGDYYHTAMILQHSDKPADHLLAHELCVAAIGKGEARAKWLAAASQDRFLMNIGRPQRFGTQYKSDGPAGPFRLHNVEDGVTDDLRRALDVPTLDAARAREAEMNR